RLALPISVASRCLRWISGRSRRPPPSLDQIEGVQHRLMSPASAPQRMEVRRPVVAGDHRLAVDADDCEHHACAIERGHHTWVIWFALRGGLHAMTMAALDLTDYSAARH